MRFASGLRVAMLTAALLMLGGCPLRVSVKSDPVDAMCEPACYEACPKLDRWDGRRDEASLERTFKIDSLQNDACEARRANCAACLDRLERNGVIKK